MLIGLPNDIWLDPKIIAYVKVGQKDEKEPYRVTLRDSEGECLLVTPFESEALAKEFARRITEQVNESC